MSATTERLLEQIRDVDERSAQATLERDQEKLEELKNEKADLVKRLASCQNALNEGALIKG